MIFLKQEAYFFCFVVFIYNGEEKNIYVDWKFSVLWNWKRAWNRLNNIVILFIFNTKDDNKNRGQRPEALSLLHMCLLPEALSLLHFASVDFIKFLFFLVFKIFVSIVQDVNLFQKNHLSKEARGQRHFHFSHVSLARGTFTFSFRFCWFHNCLFFRCFQFFFKTCSRYKLSKKIKCQRGQRHFSFSNVSLTRCTLTYSMCFWWWQSLWCWFLVLKFFG